MVVTGRIANNFTRLWGLNPQISVYFFLTVFILEWEDKHSLFQSHFTVLDFSFLQDKTELGKKKCKESHRAMRIEGCGVLLFWFELLNNKFS